MPSTRKSSDSVEGRKKRSSPRSSIEETPSPKTKKIARRGSRSSLRMQNKMSGVTMPEIKDDDNLPVQKERTPRKPSNTEREEEPTDAVVEDVVFTGEESMTEETTAKCDDETSTEEDTPHHNGNGSHEPTTTAEAEKEVTENVETNDHEDNHAPNESEEGTVSEPSPVITSAPLHVQALA